MSLTWSIETKQNAAVIHLKGTLKLGPQVGHFGRKAAQLLSAGLLQGLIIDMGGVAEIDSAGLGELVILYTSAGQVGCSLCLVAPNTLVTRIIGITRLTGILPCFASEQEARAWILSGSRS